MKVNAIIAEYNPFHKGHAYQLQESKSQTGADYTIVVMSGDFVQRGEPAILDKYTRAKMALQSGADLVLELPALYAASSAEYFATGAISMLDKLGIVDTVCFGSESGKIENLQRIAKILSEEPDTYVQKLRTLISFGLSYPTARNQALLDYDPGLNDCIDLLGSPNNILGIEYIKAIIKRNSQMTPHTILRLGAGYHSPHLDENYCSAMALRQAITNGRSFENIASFLPEESASFVEEKLRNHDYLDCDDFSQILFAKLLGECKKGFTEYLDVSESLSQKIVNHLYEYSGYQSFCNILKSKDMTYTRISRCLLHILLNITKENMALAMENDYISFARVLGFRKEASPLLHAIKENSSIPLLTKLADAPQALDNVGAKSFKDMILQNHLYAGVLACKCKRPVENEYQKQIVIL